MGYRNFDYNKMYELSKELYKRYGFTEEEATKITDVILTSDRYGIESHGVQRLTLYPYSLDIGRINKNAQMKIIKETPIAAVIDADDGMGQLTSIAAMEIAIKKAKTVGVGMVTVKNSNHFGIAGYYSMMAAKQGLMGISMTNAEALVVPTYGKQPMMGTNPIAISMPANPTAWHLDFATSVVTAGKMEVYAKRGSPIHEGLLVDENGKTSTDPNKFLEIRRTKSMGGLMPWGGEGMLYGGHKGYGFGVFVDIMTAIMSGGNVSNKVRVKPNIEKCCHFFAAIDYGMFGDKEEIEAHLSEHLMNIRDSQKADGQDRIYVHGDKEADSEKNVLENGIPMNDATIAEIKGYCDKLGINLDDYLVEVKK